MSILGLTIDYGPFEFIDHFNKRHISNYSDREGRYCYENQPEVKNLSEPNNKSSTDLELSWLFLALAIFFNLFKKKTYSPDVK